MSERAAGHAPGRALPPVQRQRTDVTVRSMLALFALILSVLFLILGTAYWLYPQEVRDQRFVLPAPDFPSPKLQPSPAVDMSVFRAEEMRQLNGTGWRDKAAGTAHVPIAQAMDLVAKEGIPGWPTSPDASEGARR